MAIPSQVRKTPPLLTPEEAAYIAGFIDGEGCFQIHYRLHRNNFDGIERTWTGYSIGIDVGQTQREILEYLKEKAGAGFITVKPSHGNRKPSWLFRIAGRAAQAFASQIRPYLR